MSKASESKMEAGDLNNCTCGWEFVSNAILADSSQLNAALSRYKTLVLAPGALLDCLQDTELGKVESGKENPSPGIELMLPLPDGTFMPFILTESLVMDPVLAAKYPQIKTFAGQGKDKPLSLVRLELNEKGLFAMISLENSTSYIQPYKMADTIFYITYSKDNIKPHSKFPFELRGPEKDW